MFQESHSGLCKLGSARGHSVNASPGQGLVWGQAWALGDQDTECGAGMCVPDPGGRCGLFHQCCALERVPGSPGEGAAHAKAWGWGS